MLQMCCRNASKRPSIDSDLALDPYLILKEIKHLICIMLKVHWIRFSSRPAISSIIPYKTIYLLAQKELQVECLRVVDHMLVAHCVWVTDYESVIVQIRAV